MVEKDADRTVVEYQAESSLASLLCCDGSCTYRTEKNRVLVND